MRPGIRMFALTIHITLSVGWIGAVLAYLVLVIAAMTGQSDLILRSAWIAMELIGLYLIVPLALTSVVSGFVMAIGTPWGLLKHYWVLVSLGLTLFATIILLQHMGTVTFFARVAAESPAHDIAGLRGALRGELLHAGVGLIVLLMIEALNVHKPQGITAFGRAAISSSAVPSVSGDRLNWSPTPASGGAMPFWVRAAGLHVIGLAVLMIIMHLAGGGLQQH